jgi:hypothetical protein
MGDATNLAARLMAKAAPGEIIAGERLYNTCSTRFEWTPLEPFLVKGKRAPVNAFVVERVAGDDSKVEVQSADAPMVGRDEELAALLHVIETGAWSSSSARPASERAGCGTRRGESSPTVDGS